MFARGLKNDLSKFSDDFTPFFRLSKTLTKSLDKIKKSEAGFVAKNIMNRCAKFHGDSRKGKKGKFNIASAIEISETVDFFFLPVYILQGWPDS